MNNYFSGLPMPFSKTCNLQPATFDLFISTTPTGSEVPSLTLPPVGVSPAESKKTLKILVAILREFT